MFDAIILIIASLLVAVFVVGWLLNLRRKSIDLSKRSSLDLPGLIAVPDRHPETPCRYCALRDDTGPCTVAEFDLMERCSIKMPDGLEPIYIKEDSSKPLNYSEVRNYVKNTKHHFPRA